MKTFAAMILFLAVSGVTARAHEGHEPVKSVEAHFSAHLNQKDAEVKREFSSEQAFYQAVPARP